MNSRVERMFGAREDWGKGNERERVEAGKREKTPSDPLARAASPVNGGGEKEGVKGFVSIRCGGCGKIVNTCLHEVRTIFNCKDCGHPNKLENLKTMKVECPRCSFRGLYKTNREDGNIVMECLNCSHPVHLRKGKRRGNYVTIREERQ